MNVIRLRDKYEKSYGANQVGDSESSEEEIGPGTFAVADNLQDLIPCDKDYFAIYVVALKTHRLIEPFGILELEDGGDIDRISLQDERKNQAPMWNWKEKDAPLCERTKGSVLKLNFWKLENKIHFSWNDLIVEKGSDNQYLAPKSLVRKLMRTEWAYLTLPMIDNDCFDVYSENAYTYYLAAGSIKRNKITCCISFESNDQCFQYFQCGHTICSSCFSKLNSKRCPMCNDDDKEYTVENCPRVKFRSGHCPFDICGNTQMQGVVLSPCGCHIACDQLMAELKSQSDLGETLKILPNCPYDACKKKIEKIVRFFP